MANTFLKMKWRKLFHTHDFNKDSVLSIEDSNAFSTNYSKHYQLSKETSMKAKDNVQRYFKEWMLRGYDKMDEDTFVRETEKAYIANKEEFRENARRLYSLIIQVVDRNGDGLISEQEFEVMAKCTNFENYNSAFMKAYPQVKEGYISLGVFLDSFVEFVCNEDESNIEVEKPRHIGFGLITKID